MLVFIPNLDPKQSLAFLISIVDFLNSDKHSRDALVLARMEAAHYQLATGDSVACKATIDECKVIIDTELSGVDSTINACFYRVSADYYKAKAAYPPIL